jgi:predicted  nucleic acid-binding Zn-ribbon protein
MPSLPFRLQLAQACLHLLQGEQQRLAEAEKAAAQAARKQEDLQRALQAAQQGGGRLEAELQAERQALAAAQADAQEAHADAAQKQQVPARLAVWVSRICLGGDALAVAWTA